MMQRIVTTTAVGLWCTLLAANPLAAQQPGRSGKVARHEIRLVQDRAQETFRFEPDRITARPGDLLVFRVVSGAPHSIALAGDKLAPAVRAAWNGAFPGRVAELRGPLLARTGQTYQLVVPNVPPGEYRFFCLSHRAYDEAGVVKVLGR